MKRSVRNGIAIAGMAGGMWLLGQAVASADTVSDAANNVDQTNTSTDGGGGANINLSEAEAVNVTEVDVDTDIDGGDGGYNSAEINTGVVADQPRVEVLSVESEPNGDAGAIEVNFESGDVTLTQEANGGDVNHSGNVAVGDLPDQTATATNNVNQSNTSEGDGHDWNGGPHDGPAALSNGNGNHHDDGGINVNGSSAEAVNVTDIDVDTDIDGGDGGSNYASINTGIIGNTFYCPAYSTCTYNFTTGNVTVYQSANGGDVNGSGNVGIGAPVPGVGHECECDKPVVRHDDCPKHQPEVKPAARPEARPHAAVSPAKLSSAQPTSTLAFTGSTGDDISLPLTLGLLALGLGGALTLAGRRRETQTA